MLVVVSIACSLSGCSKSNSQPTWKEEVLLHDGRILLVTRTESSDHPISHQSISFKNGDELVTWEDNHKWRIDYTPLILDFVDNEPVIVIPVYRYAPCREYDYPQEGVVAFRFSQNKWIRVSIAELPNSLAVNLLQGDANELARWPEYQQNRIFTNEIKAKIDSDSLGPQKQNTKLDEAIIKYFSTLGAKESCASIQPSSNPAREATRIKIAYAINNAPTIQATLEQIISIPKKLANDERYPKQGISMEGGLIAFECKELVERLEPIYKFQLVGDTESSSLNGYQFFLTNKEAIPRQVQLPNGAFMNRLLCNDKEIYAIARQNSTILNIYRFTNLGELKQALRVNMPNAEEICKDKNWGDIWDVKLLNNDLEITLVDGGKNKSDGLNRQHVYKVPLQEQRETPNQ
jgi:hypothetical protein